MKEQHREAVSATLSDVAREAGVSLATASRVVNGSTRVVAEAYRERVLAAAQQLGYTANIAAQTTARGTSPTVALLVADIADPYFGMIAAGVTRGAEEEGLIVTIAVTGRDSERESELVHALRGQRPRGVILASSRASHDGGRLAEELDALQSMGGRVAVFGGSSGPSITIDNWGGAKALGAEMARIGYRRAIALVAASGVEVSDDRLAGFAAGFAEHGGEVARVYRGGFTRESGGSLMAQAIADGVPDETLVFGVSDVVAVGAMTAARDTGIDVGGAVGFCGFDNVPLTLDVTPKLTTVVVPLEEIGYEAFRMIVSDDQAVKRDLEVVVRGSTPGVPR